MSSYRTEGYLLLKRVLDVIFSAVLLMLLAIPMAVIAVIIRLTSEGRALFCQVRVGRDGKEFVCYKFRTMYEWAPKNCPKSELPSADSYVTPVGRFLRKTSFDELPQLFNVLVGDMSLVGPRPLIGEEGEIHLLRQRCGVYRLRPGITGLAQVSGRDSVTDMEKVRFDARYAREVSLGRDAGILLRTVFGAMSGK